MARNRIIKKEFYTDQKIIELEIPERLLFIGMTNFSDDTGIHINSPKMLKCEIFPADDMKAAYIEKALDKMANLGLIDFNEDGSLIKIKNWSLHQKINRPYPSKYEFVEGLNEHSVNTHGTISEQSSPNNNKKNKKKEKKNNNTNFECFWSLYIRKIGKPKCETKFDALLQTYSLEDIIEGTEKWVDYWKKSGTDMQYVPHPYTFLSQERFMDVPDTIENQTNVTFNLDTTGNFYVGFCGKCHNSGFYRKEELTEDSKCCRDKVLPKRNMDQIQDINAKA